MSSAAGTSSRTALTNPLADPQVKKWRLDNSGVIATGAVLAFVVPPRYAVGPSGLGVTLPTLVGLISLVGWVAARGSQNAAPTDRASPIRFVLLLYLAVTALSFGVAYTRPLTALEQSGTLRALVIDLGLVGLGLATADGVRGEFGARRVVSGLLFGAYFSALVALGQKLFKFGYDAYWQNVPILRTGVANERIATTLSARAIGTANHPIELSVVSAVLVGLAVVQSRHARSRQAQLTHRLGALLLIVGCLLAVSRSGFIALVIVVVFLLGQLPRRSILNAVVLGLAGVAFVQLFAHGTLSTLRYQLLQTGSDNSSKGRTSDYGPVFQLVDQRKLFGLGLGTYNPKQYRYLDNSWLGALVTGGILTVTVLGLMVLVTMYVAGRSRTVRQSAYLQDVVRASSTAVLALAVAAYFFDEFSYPQATLVLFLLIGLVGVVGSARTQEGIQ